MVAANIAGTTTRSVTAASCGFRAISTPETKTMVRPWTKIWTTPSCKQLREVVEVARHARHQPTGLLAGVEVDRQPLEMGEHLDAEVVEEALTHAAGPR